MIKNDKKGFTLIELLVVVSIIGLLSTMAVVSLNGARKKARDAKRVSEVKQIGTLLEMFAAIKTAIIQQLVVDGQTQQQTQLQVV